MPPSKTLMLKSRAINELFGSSEKSAGELIEELRAEDEL